MQIAYLVDHPHLVPQLADLNFEQWGHLHSGDTLEQRTLRLVSAIGVTRLHPYTPDACTRASDG